MSFMQEVMEQAERLRAFCAEKDILDALQGLELAAFERVVFTGMGSSYAASYLAAMRANELGVNAVAMEPDTLQYSFPVLWNEKTLVVAISQSGNSRETVAIAREVPSCRLIAIVNQEENKLAALTPHRVLLHAGYEQHTASKTYTNSIAAAYRVAEWLGGAKESVLKDADALCDTMQQMLDDWERAGEKLSAFFEDAKAITLMGGGTSFATAFQTDYVLAEMDRLFTKAMTPAQFFHGMIETADEKDRVILLDGDERYAGRIREVLEILRERKSKVALITPRSYEGMEADENFLLLPLPVSHRSLFPMADILYIEFLGYALGVRKGLRPGELTYVHK